MWPNYGLEACESRSLANPTLDTSNSKIIFRQNKKNSNTPGSPKIHIKTDTRAAWVRFQV
jgi:hypothetical protein